VPGALSLWVKRPRRETNHSPHTVPRSRICGSISPFPNTPSSSSAQLKHREKFNFTLYAIFILTVRKEGRKERKKERKKEDRK
jgi:hypothetical protein